MSLSVIQAVGVRAPEGVAALAVAVGGSMLMAHVRRLACLRQPAPAGPIRVGEGRHEDHREP